MLGSRGESEKHLIGAQTAELSNSGRNPEPRVSVAFVESRARREAKQGHGHSGAAALGVSRNGLFWEPAGSGGGLLGSLAQNQLIMRPVLAFPFSFLCHQQPGGDWDR